MSAPVASACQRARARAHTHTHTHRTVDPDAVEILKQASEGARDEAELSRLQKLVKPEPMSPTAQRAAKRAAARKSEETASDDSEAASPARTMRERGLKVSTPTRKQRADSDDEYVLSPNGNHVYRPCV